MILNENEGYYGYLLKRRSRISAAYESKNMKELRAQMSAAFIYNNTGFNRNILSLNS